MSLYLSHRAYPLNLLSFIWIYHWYYTLVGNSFARRDYFGDEHIQKQHFKVKASVQ